MSTLVYEKNTKVYWALAVSNIAAPTVAEITAAINWSPFMTKDGVTRQVTTNMVDTASIDTDFDSQDVGSWGTSIDLTFRRDDADESDSYDIFVRGTAGYVIICPFGTPAAGDQVEVFPAKMHTPKPQQSAANTVQTFVGSLAVHAEPNLHSVVAA